MKDLLDKIGLHGNEAYAEQIVKIQSLIDAATAKARKKADGDVHEAVSCPVIRKPWKRKKRRDDGSAEEDDKSELLAPRKSLDAGKNDDVQELFGKDQAARVQTEDEKLQEIYSEDLARMASILKATSLEFGNILREDKKVRLFLGRR
ncbi:hypothetical protein HDU96_010128 [Phlyctochytrium bullatum]|nr:hypothetical protein HDU96_010128 [Phlyctochytrium bullatum]